VAVLVALSFLAVSGSSFGAEHKHGIGFGIDSGTLDSDPLPEALEFTGFTLFGKIGFTDNWGLFISVRDMEDDELLLGGEEDSYTQIGVHAAYMWRPDMRVRPHVKFGIARTDFDAELPGNPTLSDDGVGISIGGGLEAGTQRVAFFGEADATVVSLLQRRLHDRRRDARDHLQILIRPGRDRSDGGPETPAGRPPGPLTGVGGCGK
jgi:hypothetical protein